MDLNPVKQKRQVFLQAQLYISRFKDCFVIYLKCYRQRNLRYFRLQLIKPDQGKNIISNDALSLLWIVIGGFLRYLLKTFSIISSFIFYSILFSHIILCNLLSTILKPNFEEPLDTPKQLIDKNITLYYIPGGYQLKRSLLTSPIPDYNKLGETMYIPKDWVIDFTLMWKNRTIKEGTHAFFASHLGGVMLAASR